MPTPSVDAYGHRDQHTRTHTERESVFIDARTCLLLTGLKMIFLWVTVWSIQRWGGGPCFCSLQKTLGPLPPPLISSAGAVCGWRQALHRHFVKEGCDASSSALLPHQWLPYIALCFKATVGNSLSHWFQITTAEMFISLKHGVCPAEKECYNKVLQESQRIRLRRGLYR